MGAAPTRGEKITTTPDREGDSMTSLEAVRNCFARNEGFPVADVLTEDRISNVLNEHGVQH
jgi:hypothetical protein